MSSYDDEKVFNEYLKTREDNNSKHNTTVRDNLVELLGDISSKDIVDLGCGIGEFTKYFSDNGANYVLGIDISEKVLKYSQQNNNANNIDYLKMNLDDISNINKKFDIVFSDIVFNYIENFDKLIKNIFKLLKHNGILVFSQVHPISTASKNIESVWIKNDTGQMEFLLDNYSNVSIRKKEYFTGIFNFYHRRFEDIINTLIKNGFEILELREPYATEKEYSRPSFLLLKAKKLD